jgi:hypothetical protein
MSVSSYVRVRCPVEEAMARYGGWIGLPELAPPRLVRERDGIDLALADGEWIGLAVFIYPSHAWTVIEELSGGLGDRPIERWLELAQGGDLVYAGYNDAVPYAQLIIVERGQLVRRYLQDKQDASADVDVGCLPDESNRPFDDWVDVMSWVEGDQDQLVRPGEGWLWIHRSDLRT